MTSSFRNLLYSSAGAAMGGIAVVFVASSLDATTARYFAFHLARFFYMESQQQVYLCHIASDVCSFTHTHTLYI